MDYSEALADMLEHYEELFEVLIMLLLRLMRRLFQLLLCGSNGSIHSLLHSTMLIGNYWGTIELKDLYI